MNQFSIEELDPSGDLRQSADDAGAWDPNGTRRNLLRKAGIGGAAVFGVNALLSPLDALAAAARASSQARRSCATAGTACCSRTPSAARASCRGASSGSGPSCWRAR